MGGIVRAVVLPKGCIGRQGAEDLWESREWDGGIDGEMGGATTPNEAWTHVVYALPEGQRGSARGFGAVGIMSCPGGAAGRETVAGISLG